MPDRMNLEDNRYFTPENPHSLILTAWVRRVEARGAMDTLFRLEAWLKGLRSFFNLDHMPLSETEREDPGGRNFAPEVAVVRAAVPICEALSSELIRVDMEDDFPWDAFLQAGRRRARMPNFDLARIARQLSPRDSIVDLLEFLNDLRVTLDAVKNPSALSYPYFRSLGRWFELGMGSSGHIDRLLSRRFKRRSDGIGGEPPAELLAGIPDVGARQGFTIALLDLFRVLRYLTLIAEDLERDRPLKQDLVLFSLIHEEMNRLADFLRGRFLKDKAPRHPWEAAAERVAYSLRMEAQRVLRRELVFVSRETDPSAVYTKMENGHGLLRNCGESCITALLEAADADFDAAVLFPYKAKQRADAEKLRRDLGDLRQWLTDVLANREELDANRIAERLTSFKNASRSSLMHRDWAEFESFLDNLALTGNFIQIRTHIRKFVSFLEMLIQEISKRSVLQSRPPAAEAESGPAAR